MLASGRRLAMSQANPFSRLFQQQAGSAASVKLAILQPGEQNAPIKVSLTDANPNEASYECISYNRSKDEDTVNITVDDKTQAIPKHLETGLRTLRRKERPRTLWADLLVGSNAEERSRQAATVRNILENAEKTLCWTGEDNNKTAKVYGTIREMANRWKQGCTEFGLPANPMRGTPQQLQNLLTKLRSCRYDDLNSFDFDHWKEIYNVFSSEYWRSVQSISEIVLAKNAIIMCGRSNITWQDFVAASMAMPVFHGKFFQGVPLLPGVMKTTGIVNSIAIADRRRRGGEAIELLPMIQTARDHRPRDPRESVFSMLPIVNSSARLESHQGEKPQLPDIDYSKTVQEVFIEASRYIVMERQDLLIWWGERQPSTKRIKGLPSWVPDWSRGNKSQMRDPKNGLRAWTDSPNIVKKPIRISDNNELHVQAYPVDRISYLSPLFSVANFRRLALEELQKLPVFDSETREVRNERFWRTLINNLSDANGTMTALGVPTAELGISFASMMAEEEILIILNCTMEELAKPEVTARIDRNNLHLRDLFMKGGKSGDFQHEMMRNSLGRRFFVTEQGRFGMTGIENYALLDDPYLLREPGEDEVPEEAEVASNAGPSDTNAADRQTMGELLSNPFARDMLQHFQQHLQQKDPNLAKTLGQAMRGDLPYQKEQELERRKRSRSAKEGDMIVACVGGFLPYILRPMTSSSEDSATTANDDARYEYIGDSYVHGMMEGECFHAVNANGVTVWNTDISKVVDISIV